MNFEFNENQNDLRMMVRELAEKEIGPRAKENDEKDVFPVDIFKMMADMGLTGIGVPEEYGGPEATDIERMIAIEEIAKKDGAVATILAVHGMLIQALVKYGTEEQKKRFLPRIAEEGYYTAFALTEPGAGSDPASAKTTAVYDPETDEYVLNGNKCFITGGARADAILVFALTDPSKGAKGMSAFIVEKGTPGLSTGKEENKMGIRTSNTCDVVLEDVRIPASNLIGEEGRGFNIAMQTLDQARTWMGCVATGIAQRGINEAIAYGKERVQFGKPIIKNQALKFKVADMEIKTETARQMVAHALTKMDLGLPYTKESAIAKCYASDIAMEVASEAIQMFGGYGYSREYPVEKLLRDAKIFQIFEGTNEVQRIVISNSVIGK